jgi:hypothetical protein
MDPDLQYGFYAASLVGTGVGGYVVVSTVGVGTTVSFVAREAASAAFEAVTGVPVLVNPSQAARSFMRPNAIRNGGEAAAQVIRPATGGASATVAHNAADFARYKDQLRAAMSRPHVTDSTLARYMDELYRPDALIGSGSTAAAVRHELATGGTVGGRTHSRKARDMIIALQRWLKSNPQASLGDRAAAENVIQDMVNALDGN